LLASCRSEVAPGPERRQTDLGERILNAALHARSVPAQQADAGLALRELAVPTATPQLRLLAAGDSPDLAAGAAEALVRIRLLRAGDRRAALVECVQSESNVFVQAACLDHFDPFVDASTANLVLGQVGASAPEVRHAALRLIARRADAMPQEATLARLAGDGADLAPAREAVQRKAALTPQPPSAASVVARLASKDAAQRREGLRELLRIPLTDERKNDGISVALVHAVTDADPAVRLLAEAASLRRSLADAPPTPESPAK